jgi:hypothetical protein
MKQGTPDVPSTYEWIAEVGFTNASASKLC